MRFPNNVLRLMEQRVEQVSPTHRVAEPKERIQLGELVLDGRARDDDAQHGGNGCNVLVDLCFGVFEGMALLRMSMCSTKWAHPKFMQSAIQSFPPPLRLYNAACWSQYAFRDSNTLLQRCRCFPQSTPNQPQISYYRSH